MIGKADLQSGLYILHSAFENSINVVDVVSDTNSKSTDMHNNVDNIWHLRLGHPSHGTLQRISNMFPFIQSNKHQACDSCHFAKQRKLPFPLSNTRSSHIFEMIHVDIWGPTSVTSLHGQKFILTIVDDFSRYTWVYLMKNKSETRPVLSKFVTLIKNQFDRKIKIIRSDNGQEFAWQEFYDIEDIVHQTSCVEMPEQNAIVERKHQHILNVTCSILFQSNMPLIFWSYAVNHAVHLINTTPSVAIDNRIPYDLLHGKMPDITSLKVFGCFCYVSSLDRNRNKFNPKSRKCMFLGYKQGIKGYIVFDIKHGKSSYQEM